MGRPFEGVINSRPTTRGPARTPWEEVAEALELPALAIAAIATAWSGYQAARTDGRQSVLYGQSSRDRLLLYGLYTDSTLPRL